VAELVLTFVPVCVATAYVCTVVKEDRTAALAMGTFRLAAMLAFGIAAFGAAILILSTAFTH
jgi:hypothetical protein